MYADWTDSSNGLPREGQQVEFMLDCRPSVMEGSYLHQAFRSKWAEYDVERVRSWRHSTRTGDVTAAARSQAERMPASAARQDAGHHPLAAVGAAHAA